MIDQQTIERILDAANIVEVIRDFVPLKKRGVNYRVCVLSIMKDSVVHGIARKGDIQVLWLREGRQFGELHHGA